MLIVGLTGSIGMGKSTAAEHFRARGVPVFDADGAVHALYRGEDAALIEAAFPGTVINGEVDRVALSAWLQAHPEGFAKLEAIVHPRIRAAEKAFLLQQQAAGAEIAVLEVPLLFETGGDRRVDAKVVLSTDPATQRARVLARPGMTAEKLSALLSRQTPDGEKRARADFVVDTSGPVEDTREQIDMILARLKLWPQSAFKTIWLVER